MKFSRRDLSFLLPALAAGIQAKAALRLDASAVAQEKQTPTLPSKVYHHQQIPYAGDQKKKARRFFYGANHSAFNFEMHETILGPGTETHAPHKHEHEEIMIVFEGTVEAYLEGKRETAETGSVFYFGSNQMHTVRNAGTTPCRYYVIELRGHPA